ncbi:MAG: PLP-dependent aminotransferase family protein [Pseudomonadota bacterium]|nr:PLP-dependent aminotransferase family protein [Pseudomonadota bacterium]
MNAPAPNRVGLVLAALRARIDSRALPRGARLPSVRRLAEELGVSKSTVVEAYDRLAAESAVEPRRGSGFYVAAAPEPLKLAAAPTLDPAVDLLTLVRRALEDRPHELHPASGWLPESWLPEAGIGKAMRAVARGPAPTKLRYDSPHGFEPLRRLIAARLAERGAPIDPARLVLTDSTTQALDLALRFFLSPGDRVLVDDPRYFNLAPLVSAHRAEMATVPYTREGPDLAALERVFAEKRPRVYLMLVGPHNPTGATLSAAVAHRVLSLAEAHDVVILEDDIYGDFESQPSPRLAALDGYRRVLQVGGYSKTVTAALKIAYIAGRADWIDALVDLKLATTLGNSSFAAATMHAFLAEGGYRRHLDALRPRLAAATARLSQQLQALGVRLWVEPRAGLFAWGELPDGLDATEVARFAQERNVVFAPGRSFSADPRWRGFMRFNVAASADPRVFEALAFAMAKAGRSQGA